MKRLTIFSSTALGLLALLAWSAPALLGFSVWRLDDALDVVVGLGAKLGCSGHFLTGLDEEQLIEDLASYSPVSRLLDLDIGERRVTASLLGLARAHATYRPGIGCSLDIGDTRDLDAVTPTRVPASGARWPAGDTVASIDPRAQAALAATLQQDNAAGLDTRALVLVRGDDIVAEAYADGFGSGTPLLGFSMGKSVTAIMIGRMQQLGLLPADERDFRADALFPEWQDDARRGIRLVDLLHMTSGLRWDETYAPGSDSTRILFQVHSASDVAMQSPPEHAPGEYFQYSSGTTNLLSRFVHDRLGGTQGQFDFFGRAILAPLGMHQTYFEPDPSGVFVGSSYIYASARDWARLGLLMLNRGVADGRQLLATAWVDRARTPNAGANDGRYGYQFWLNAGKTGEPLRWPGLPADAYAMMGNREQVVMVIPSADTVLVRLGWSSEAYPLESNFARLLEARS